MSRSKRFRKKQTKRKTKKIIVGGVKVNKLNTRRKINPEQAAPVSRLDLTQVTRNARERQTEAAKDEARRMSALAIQASAHAEKKRAEYLDAARAAARARTYLAQVTAAVAESEDWAAHQGSAYSAETLHEMSEGEKKVKGAANRAAAIANALAARALNTWQIAKNEANERAREARLATYDSATVDTHAQRVASFLPPLTAPPSSSNVFSDLIDNTTSMLAALKSPVAPHASTLPPPPLTWRRL